MGRLRAGSGPLDHKDGSASLDRGAIRERRSCWLCSAARPSLTPQKKNGGVGPKRKPSSSWAVKSRRFFCERAGFVFCERVGSGFFLHRLKLHNNLHCVENLVLFVL